MPPQDPTHATLKRPDELARDDFEFIVRRLAEDIAFGADASMFVGSGLEYAGSRPYQAGDSVRSLNWRLTARTGRPFVKEYEALKRCSLYVVVDTSGSMAVSSCALSKHDLAVWIAAGLGMVGQRRLSPVAIVGAGGRETRVEPSLNRRDLWRALEPLRHPDTTEPTLLGERLRALAASIGRSNVIAVLSDLHHADSLPALRQAAQGNDCMVIHLQDPAEAGRLRAGFVRGREAETGVAFTAHSRTRWGDSDGIKADLARAGIDYLRLRVDQPFIPALRHFLSSRGGLMGARG